MPGLELTTPIWSENIVIKDEILIQLLPPQQSEEEVNSTPGLAYGARGIPFKKRRLK